MAQRNGNGYVPSRGRAEATMRLLPSKRSAGPFAVDRFPLLPLEEEGRLNDMPLRENSIERVFAYYRWTRMLDKEPTADGLLEFQSARKRTLMAHSPKQYTKMGRLVADAGKRDWQELTAGIVAVANR